MADMPPPVASALTAAAPAGVPAGPASPRSEALRELQARLASQLQAAQNQERGRAWLAVECTNTGLLLPLSEAGEIFPYRGSVAVPHTRPWFLGVANLRGALHGVVDLGRFLGLGDSLRPPGDGWMVGLNPRLESNSALRVDRLAGLRRDDQLREIDPPQAERSMGGSSPGRRPRFAGAVFTDGSAAGRRWQEISLVELAGDAHFLDITAPP